MKLKIAETFHSIQGEGFWAGTPMHFVRLAGCSVGKPKVGSPSLPTHGKAWQCHTYDGRAFWCDTDFTKQIELDPDEIIRDTYEKHLCVTGGEPMMSAHWEAVCYLLLRCIQSGIFPHIETSGTVTQQVSGINCWIAVSPKEGVTITMLDRADELKLLVDADFNDEVMQAWSTYLPKIWLQPVNDITQINQANLNHCLDLLHTYPQCRLSVQLHKLIGVR